MQPVRSALPQDINGAQADAQMLVHALAVEMVGHAGQLDFAMPGLVAHAQKRAIRHPKPEAIGGDGGAFHVERNGSALVEAALGRLSGSRSQLRLSVLATVPVRLCACRTGRDVAVH